MKDLKIIVILLALVCCKQRSKLSPLLIEELNYSSYAWYYSPKGWDFYLNSLIQIDKEGNYRAAYRQSDTSKLKYYQGRINDSLYGLLNNTFQVDTFKSDYKTAQIENVAYDGYTYCMDFKKQNGGNKKIIFIRSGSPIAVERVSLVFNRVMSTSKTTSTDYSKLDNYITKLKAFSAVALSPLPQLDTTPFHPPKIH